MKTLLKIFVCLILIAGAWLAYKITSPEYALHQTITDVKESGINGLEMYLTPNAQSKLDAIDEWSSKTGISQIISSLTQDEVYSVLKDKVSEIEWTIEDVLKGKGHAEAILRLNYNDSINGTIRVILIRDGYTWKIDDIERPNIESFTINF